MIVIINPKSPPPPPPELNLANPSYNIKADLNANVDLIFDSCTSNFHEIYFALSILERGEVSVKSLVNNISFKQLGTDTL